MSSVVGCRRVRAHPTDDQSKHFRAARFERDATSSLTARCAPAPRAQAPHSRDTLLALLLRWCRPRVPTPSPTAFDNGGGRAAWAVRNNINYRVGPGVRFARSARSSRIQPRYEQGWVYYWIYIVSVLLFPPRLRVPA